ncbi:MAG TPA: BamA/TamA family outer membrane protein [Gemmatimonadaceae bacterium]
MTPMVRRPLSQTRSLLAPFLLAVALLAPATSNAQYFGRNKVPYERFRFEVLRSPHWDVHYYQEEATAARDASRMLERWNTRFSSVMAHTLSKRKPVILYADHPDFQQTNVISGTLTEGTGGVTESLLDRMVLPMTGYYAETDHVLGHEAVHVFQYDIANKTEKNLNFERMPLWFVEGMAEYLSVGPEDAHTAMWLRDALQRNDLPTINDLTNSGKYFPYRYGEALWAYIGGTWGDDKVQALFRSALEVGIDQATIKTLGMRTDTLSRRWHDAIRAAYGPMLEGRTAPRATGRSLIAPKPGRPEYFVGPAVSPDGKLVAYFHSGIRGVELKLVDAATGEDRGTLAAPGLSTRFDALSFLYSAGSWSPDGKRLAFVSYSEGDNEIDIVNVGSRDIERRIKPNGVGAISTVAWSPDGERLAFSGMTGGISDLYLFELASGMTRRLTNDLNADMQPAWSPDGSTIAFITDRDVPLPEGVEAGSDFRRLSHAPLRLAVVDATSGSVQVLPAIPGAKHVSPQFTADGRSILFVSDRGGYSDLYRLEVESGALFQVTRAATGISGISEFSPALSVARGTGTTVFSVFEQGGLMLASLSQAEIAGERLPAPDVSAPATAALLPGGGVGERGVVRGYVTDFADGLPMDTTISGRPYRAGLKLAYIGPPSLGASIGGPFGTTVQGGASAYFSDLLGNHFLGVGVQASGTLRDIGGQALYINSERRWTWGVSAERTPYLYAFGTVSPAGLEYILAHVAVTGGSVLTQYARSASNRIEMSAGYQHYDYYFESRNLLGGDTQPIESPAPLGLGRASIAYVGDDASMGYTSPFAGTRFRFEASPTIGSLNYQTYTADVRRYAFMRPFTLAFRGIHYGRYGRDSDSDRIGSIFLGDPTLVRGYSYDSFDSRDCNPDPNGSLGTSTCPQFDRLLGSRVGVANLEFRIPLFGARGLGLIESAFPPLEIAPFFDAGVAWTGTSAPVWSSASNSADRTPVMSTGVTSRLNLFGFAILEVYYARPFQRPGRGGVWGFLLQPGW